MKVLRFRHPLRCLIIVPALLLLLLGAGSPAAAQTDQRCFAETGYCISGAIRVYWERNGGLPIFGYPIGPQQTETVEGTWTGPVQWFQRDRLEDHSNEGLGVLTGRLGAEVLAWQGTPWETLPRSSGPTPADCRLFPETGHTVCEPYLSYWERNGGLTRFGYPISPPMAESVGNWYGGVQYFERRRMEHHVEYAGTPSEVLLGLLGQSLRDVAAVATCPDPVYDRWRGVFTRVSFRSALGCPQWPLQIIGSAYQPFEHGQMIWLELPDGPMIYVLPERSRAAELGQVPWRYQMFADTWREGDPGSGGLTPPDGLYEPLRGFGKLWREHPELRDQLGWGVAPERGSSVERQQWSSGGSLLSLSYVTDDPRHGFIFVYAFSPDGQVELVSR